MYHGSRQFFVVQYLEKFQDGKGSDYYHNIIEEIQSKPQLARGKLKNFFSLHPVYRGKLLLFSLRPVYR